MNKCIECLGQGLSNDSILRDSTQAFNGGKSRLLTIHTNANLSVLEAVFGRSFTTPTYAKTRAPKTPAREKAEVEVKVEAAVASAMAMVAVFGGRP